MGQSSLSPSLQLLSETTVQHAREASQGKLLHLPMIRPEKSRIGLELNSSDGSTHRPITS